MRVLMTTILVIAASLSCASTPAEADELPDLNRDAGPLHKTYGKLRGSSTPVTTHALSPLSRIRAIPPRPSTWR